MKIALIKLSSIGDVIHTLPLAMGLKRGFPEAHLVWIVQAEPAPLLREHPAVDSTRIFPRRGGIGAGLAFLGKLVREGGYDLAVDAQGNMKSGLVTLATRAGKRLGFHENNCRERLNRLAMNRCLPPATDTHVVDRTLAFSRYLDCPDSWEGFGLTFLEEEQEKVRHDLKSWGIDPARKTACFNIRPESDVREWPAERYAALADRLTRERGFQVILNAGPAHREAADRVHGLTRAKAIFNLAGRNDIRELAIQYLLLAGKDGVNQGNFFFGCDSAPLHLAHAVGLPVVGLYGSQNPDRNGPYRGDARVIDLIDDLPCAPCRKRSCPSNDHDRACMTGIRVDRVWQAIECSRSG